MPSGPLARYDPLMTATTKRWRSPVVIGAASSIAVASLSLLSTRRPLLVEGSAWRFGLVDARFGVETWKFQDPSWSLLPPTAAVIVGGPWYHHGMTMDMPTLGWWGAGVTKPGVHWWYVTVMPLILLPVIAGFTARACSRRHAARP